MAGRKVVRCSASTNHTRRRTRSTEMPFNSFPNCSLPSALGATDSWAILAECVPLLGVARNHNCGLSLMCDLSTIASAFRLHSPRVSCLCAGQLVLKSSRPGTSVHEDVEFLSDNGGHFPCGIRI